MVYFILDPSVTLFRLSLYLGTFELVALSRVIKCRDFANYSFKSLRVALKPPGTRKNNGKK